MQADILAGQPLRPTTPVPGLWLVDAPDTIYVRVYAAPPLLPVDPPPVTGDVSSANAETSDAAASRASGSSSQPQPPPGAGDGDEAAEAKQESTSPTSHLKLPSLSPTKVGVPSPTLSKSPTTALSLSLPPRSPVHALKSQPGTPKGSQTPRDDADSKQTSPTKAFSGMASGDGGIPRPPSPSSTLDNLRSDPLERAWLAINASDTDVTAAALARPCAVVKPGEERRELWVFSPDDGPIPVLEELGLTEVDVPDPIKIAEAVTCPDHGHSLSCLEPDEDGGDDEGSKDKKSCFPTFTPPESWPLLECAVGEKVAWKLGTRMSLIPGDASLADPPFDVSLSPAPGKLVLIARLRPLPYCAPQRHNGTDPGIDPLVLRPLALPALLVAAHNPTPAQDVRLSAAFDLALGPSWKNGRSEARVAAQAAYGRSSDWSVYWVPLERGEEVVEGTLPHALAAQWRSSNGVLTVWPTHLARPLARSLPPVPAKLSPPDGTLGSPPDLMGMAADVFSFLGSYTAPADEEDEDAEAEGEEPPEVDGDVAMEDESKASDVDDLFSAHTSPAPTASRAVSRAPTVATDTGDLFASSALGTPTAHDDMGMDEDLFGDDDTATVVADNDAHPGDGTTPTAESAMEMLPPPLPPTATQLSSKAPSPRDITEDDFKFFDSPAPDTSPEKLFEEPVSHAPHPPLDDHTGKELATPANAYGTLPLPDTTPVSLPAVIEEEEHAAEPPAIPEVIVPDEEVIEVVDVSSRPPQEEDTQKRRFIDIVPDAFAPVELGKRKRPKFAYGLPSPAATVSSLRLSCVERLKERATGKDKDDTYDYTRAWDVESDCSDSEGDSAMTTGAPPTPSSTLSYDDRTPANELALVPAPLPDDEVEYDGTVCVGGEWTSLQFDISAAATLARTWAPSWIDIRPAADYPTPTSPPRPAETSQVQLNLDAFANALVRNRFFREMFEDADLTAREPQRPPTMLVRGGVAISDVTSAISEGETFALAQPAVNVGFGSSVMRLNVAGLRYWRELGLAPAGGPKDLAVFVVCDTGEYNIQRAKVFLSDISEVYAAHRLGSMTAGKHESAPDGVAPTSTSELSSTISRLRGTALVSSTPTVVFVLSRPSTLSPETLNPLLAGESHLSWVHPLPLSSLQPSNLAAVAFQAYDHVPRQVDRVTMFGKPLDLPKVWLGYHAFTLAPADPAPKPELSMAWPQRNYDVLNRWRLVHAAYHCVPEWEVMIVAVTDAQGDALHIETLKLDGTARDRISRVWDVVRTFAAESATEWRASVTRHGLMSSDELEAWKSISLAHRDPLTLLMCEVGGQGAQRVRAPVPNIPPSMFADPTATIVDETLTASAAAFTHRLRVTLRPSLKAPPSATTTIFPPTSFVLGMATAGATASTSIYHVLLHRNPPGRGERADELLGPEFHRLACLGRRRYGLGTLPLPLDAVGVVAGALGKIGRPEDKESDDGDVEVSKSEEKEAEEVEVQEVKEEGKERDKEAKSTPKDEKKRKDMGKDKKE